MQRHSPGPWRIVRSSDYTGDHDDRTIQAIEDADGNSVYYTESGYFRPKEADVKLIAAAPDLLEALQRLLDKREPFLEDFQRAAAAIAKATE